MLRLLRQVMTRPGYRDWPALVGLFVVVGAMMPLTAVASGESAAIDPATAVGGGAVTAVAIGALAYAVRSLASRGTDGQRNHAPGGVDAAQSIALAELRTELRHLSQQVERHAALHDRTRDDLASAVRALDRVADRLEALAGAGVPPGPQG